MKKIWTILLLFTVMALAGGCAYGKEQAEVITNRAGNEEDTAGEEISVDVPEPETEGVDAEEIQMEEEKNWKSI